jgi:hypothetical protein
MPNMYTIFPNLDFGTLLESLVLILIYCIGKSRVAKITVLKCHRSESSDISPSVLYTIVTTPEKARTKVLETYVLC